MRSRKAVLKALFLLSFLLFLGIGYYEWTQFEPTLAAIQPKDPERYAVMTALAKDFEFRRAKKIFDELESMTEDDVIELRVKKLKKAWNESEDYQQERLREEDQARKKQRVRKQQSYASRVKEILEVFPQLETQWVSMNWMKTPPWGKALILRQKCKRILEREIRLEKSRVAFRILPRTAPYVLPRKNVVTPSKLCEIWIPLSDNERVILRAFKNLRDRLEFSQFKTLLKEIGIPEKNVMNLAKEIERLTADFSGA